MIMHAQKFIAWVAEGSPGSTCLQLCTQRHFSEGFSIAIAILICLQICPQVNMKPISLHHRLQPVSRGNNWRYCIRQPQAMNKHRHSLQLIRLVNRSMV